MTIWTFLEIFLVAWFFFSFLRVFFGSTPSSKSSPKPDPKTLNHYSTLEKRRLHGLYDTTGSQEGLRWEWRDYLTAAAKTEAAERGVVITDEVEDAIMKKASYLAHKIVYKQ